MVVGFVVLLLVAGCVRSIHPLYTEKDLIYEPGLVGTWITKEDGKKKKDSWTFSKKNEKVYTLVVGEGDTAGSFTAHLMKVKGEMFLDLVPDPPKWKENEFYRYHVLPVHTFVHVEKIGPTLDMRFPNPDWLGKYLEKNPDALKHEIEDKQLIVTASPEAMQAFWLEQLHDKKAFSDAEKMEKVEKQ
jgi:hypothetical protein